MRVVTTFLHALLYLTFSEIAYALSPKIMLRIMATPAASNSPGTPTLYTNVDNPAAAIVDATELTPAIAANQVAPCSGVMTLPIKEKYCVYSSVA
jgi:hypothetical protein